jgi:hypothetical protein
MGLHLLGLLGALAIPSAYAADDDGDGFEAGDDCNDANASVYPGAVELTDGVDNDCDGLVDEGTTTSDDDGDGYSEEDGDCDDANASANPGVFADGCASGDDDCDGLIDEDCLDGGDTATFDTGVTYTGTKDGSGGCAATDAPAGWLTQLVVAAVAVVGLRMRR